MSKRQLVKKKGRKILITGGAGFIGSHLVERLVETDQITVFDNFRRDALSFTLSKKHPNLTLVTGNVLNAKALERTIPGHEIVVHLAAIAGVTSYERNPLLTLEVDAWGTYNILKIAAQNHIKQVILSSSSEVYGPYATQVSETALTTQGPATESRWSYGVGKLVGDHFAFAFTKMTDLPITIMRPFNIYGPRQIGEGAVQIFIKQALRNEDITINGDGKQKRAWTFIDDCVDGFISSIGNSHAFAQIFNIGNPFTMITVYELAKMVIRLAKSKSQIRMQPLKGAEIIARSPDIRKAKKLLDYNPKVSFEDGLKKTILWFRSTQ
jgi:nucleoside-diphosphate-sugar epimerase